VSITEAPQGNRGFRTWVSLAVAAIVAHLAVMLVAGGESTASMWVSDLSIATAAGAAGVLGLRTGRALTGHRAAGWTLLGVGAVSWCGGELIWSTYELLLDRMVPFPSVADAAFLAWVPLALVGMVLLIGPSATGVRTLLDGLVITGALLVIAWAVVLGPIYRTHGDDLEKALSLAYPAGDVAMASMVLLLLARAEDRRRAAFTTVAAGMLALSAADGGFAYLTQIGSYATGGPLDTAWFAGFLLIALGAVRGHDVRTMTTNPEARPWVALPYLPVGVAVLTMFVSVLYGTVDTFQMTVASVVVLLVMVRLVITLRDDVRLTRELETTVRDLQDREAQLHHLAFHDQLTGLANRSLFLERTEHALATERAPGGSLLAVLYIDLDGFKQVNDTFGHHTGDGLLTAVSERLRTCVRGADTLARLGGDEFAVLVPHLADLVEADSLAARITHALAEPFTVERQHIVIGGTVGVAACAPGTAKAGELLRRADHAMYAAKVTCRTLGRSRSA
jgi:diguanylate cyclase (GGDEF)-like protein